MCGLSDVTSFHLGLTVCRCLCLAIAASLGSLDDIIANISIFIEINAF